MSKETIYRGDAIKALRKLVHEVVVIDKVCSLGVAAEFIDAIRDIPSADLNVEFAEWAKLWFKRELEADRQQGEWKRMKFTDCGSPVHKCSICGHYINGDVEVRNFCPNCGARMKGAGDE